MLGNLSIPDNSMLMDRVFQDSNPAFSVNEDIDENLRPNDIVMNDASDQHMGPMDHLAVHPGNTEQALLMSEDYKFSI